MHSITTHTVKQGDPITAMDKPGAGGASHIYAVRGGSIEDHPISMALRNDPDVRAFSAEAGKANDYLTIIAFQSGNPVDRVNGITNEVLLAIMKDRLEGLQRGPFACAENATALTNINAALNTMKARTARRIEQGTEGTHTPEAPAFTGAELKFAPDAGLGVTAAFSPQVVASTSIVASIVASSVVGLTASDAAKLAGTLRERLGGEVLIGTDGTIWHHCGYASPYRIDTEGDPL